MTDKLDLDLRSDLNAESLREKRRLKIAETSEESKIEKARANAANVIRKIEDELSAVTDKQYTTMIKIPINVDKFFKDFIDFSDMESIGEAKEDSAFYWVNLALKKAGFKTRFFFYENSLSVVLDWGEEDG